MIDLNNTKNENKMTFLYYLGFDTLSLKLKYNKCKYLFQVEFIKISSIKTKFLDFGFIPHFKIYFK